MQLAIIILIFLLILLGTIACATYAMVNKMAASPSFQPVPELASFFIDGLAPETAEFLRANGFRFHQAYQMHALRIGLWTRPDQAPLRSFSLSRIMSNSVSEFITEFSEDASLTTTTTRAAFMFPRGRGGFMQSFPRASIERLWQTHQKGEDFLLSSRSIPVSACRFTFEERVTSGIIKQLARVKSLPLWPLRGIYWFLVKRFIMANRPVWRQDIEKLYRD
jgi:hypothetical protein